MPHKELYIDGVWFPSVTTIMGAKPMPWLDAWREKWGMLAERKMKIASSIGTEFHRCVEAYINTGTYFVANAEIDGFPLTGTATRVVGMMKSFVKWAESVDGEISNTEMSIVNRTYTYSGTLDAIGTLDGRLMLFDWKTSSRIYDDMQLQLAAYAEAYNERCESKMDRVKDGLIVHVSKDKPHFKLTVKHFKLGKRPFKQFLKLREMFDDVRAKESTNEQLA
jgi:PD-(D/E)XK nuclease superfamily